MQLNLKGTYFSRFVYAIALIILIIAGSKDLFHNHEHDLNEHEDCPVHVFNLYTQSEEIVYFAFNSIITFQILTYSVSPVPSKFEFVYYFFLRAPPPFYSYTA